LAWWAWCSLSALATSPRGRCKLSTRSCGGPSAALRRGTRSSATSPRWSTPRRQKGRTPQQGHEPRPGHDCLVARERRPASRLRRPQPYDRSPHRGSPRSSLVPRSGVGTGSQRVAPDRRGRLPAQEVRRLRLALSTRRRRHQDRKVPSHTGDPRRCRWSLRSSSQSSTLSAVSSLSLYAPMNGMRLDSARLL